MPACAGKRSNTFWKISSTRNPYLCSHSLKGNIAGWRMRGTKRRATFLAEGMFAGKMWDCGQRVLLVRKNGGGGAGEKCEGFFGRDVTRELLMSSYFFVASGAPESPHFLSRLFASLLLAIFEINGTKTIVCKFNN